jgi:glycosyltransferase involved in cell wall biosynthesis
MISFKVGVYDSRVTSEPGSKPRVLVLATTVPAVRDDGTPQFALDLSLGLQREFNVLIVAPRVRSARPEEAIDGLRIERFAYFPRRWESLADGAILPNLKAHPGTATQVPFLLGGYLSAAVRAARRWRPHVIHAHWLLPGGLVALAASRLLSIPYIVTVHGADAFALRGPGLQALKRLVMRNASIVGLTSAALAEALPDVPSVPRPVIPMGVDVEGFAKGVGEREPVFGRFLFVGRLVEKKGLDVLLQALVDAPQATLVISGDGPDAPALRDLTQRLGLDDRVRFAGQVSRADLREQLRHAYAVVVPSRVAADGDQDTTPLVMSESMSAGVPVIASRLGGLAEQIESGVTGLLAEPDSAESLKDALRQALAEPALLAKCGLHARERIHGSALDLSTTVARYTEILHEVIDAGSNRRSHP